MEASSQDEAFSFASAFCHSEVDFKRVRKNYYFARGWNLSACLVEGFAGSLRNRDRGRCVQPPIQIFKLPEENNDVFLIHQKTRGHWRGE